jgi:hypothetical protein
MPFFFDSHHELLHPTLKVWERLLKPLRTRNARRKILEGLFDCRAVCISLEAAAARCAGGGGSGRGVGVDGGGSASGDGSDDQQQRGVEEAGGNGSVLEWRAGEDWKTLLLLLLERQLVSAASAERCWFTMLQQAALGSKARFLFIRLTVQFIEAWQTQISNGKGSDSDSGSDTHQPSHAHPLHFARLLVYMSQLTSVDLHSAACIKQCLAKAVPAHSVH